MGLIEAIVEPRNLLSIGVGVLVFATMLTLLGSMTGGVQLDKRMQAVSTRRDELKRKSRAAIAGGQGGLRHTDDGFKKKIVEQLNLSKLLEDPKVAEQMIQAGFRGPKPVTTFYFFRFATPIFFLLFSAFYLFFINDFGLPPITKLPMIMGATVLGFYGPNVYLQNRITKRRQSIMLGFPDALDLLLICVESGMSIELAFRKVAQEVGAQSIPLAEELTLTTAELSYLSDRRQAFENLAARTGVESLKQISTVLTQAERYGTPLGQALRVVANESRQRRMNEAEKKAAALPPKLTVPMIVFFLPVLFAVIITPAMIQVTATMH